MIKFRKDKRVIRKRLLNYLTTPARTRLLSEEEQLMAIRLGYKVLGYVKDPSEDAQILAVSSCPDYIRYIKNPSLSAKIAAIKEHPNIITYTNIEQDYKLKEYIIDNQPEYLQYITTYNGFLDKRLFQKCIESICKTKPSRQNNIVEKLSIAFAKVEDPKKAYNDLPDHLKLLIEGTIFEDTTIYL